MIKLPWDAPFHDVLAEEAVEVENAITAVDRHSSATPQPVKCLVDPRNQPRHKRAAT